MFVLRAVLAAALLALPATAVAQQVYFGNLHSHTSYSDGFGKPAQMYAHARNVGHLDFLAITEHNHAQAEAGATPDRLDGVLIANDHSLYNGPQAASDVEAAKAANLDGTFVALYGQEFSTISSGNHVNVFDAPEVMTSPNGKFDKLIEWLDAHPDSTGAAPLMQFNHPALSSSPAAKEYGRDDFGGSDAAWLAAVGPHVSLIELLNGPAMAQHGLLRSEATQEKDYFEYLNYGFHLAPSAGQDNHYITAGTVTDARVAILANSLTKASVMDALRQRHAYATEDKNLRVIFRVGQALQGDIVAAPAVGAALDLKVAISDDDEANANYKVEVFKDRPGGPPINSAAPVLTKTIHGNSASVLLSGVTFEHPGEYVLLKITQTGGTGGADRAWTAPVWFGN